MDKYGIDSHKLMHHVSRVSDWMKGERIYPIYMEISPSRACNYRCTYCGLDFLEYKPEYLEAGLLKERLSELQSLGLKSVMYAGEGEPFLHKDMAEIINHTKNCGIDVGITTNGVLFDKEISDSILGNTEWIKVSVDGAIPDTYSKIHRTNPENFNKVIANMSYAAKIKKDNNYACTLGIQLLLLPENYSEAVALAKLAQSIGMDYLVVKPYSQHPQSKTDVYNSINYSRYQHLEDELAKLNTSDFNVIFRIQTMKKWDNADKAYKHCFSFSFWSYIDSCGNVWGCSVYLGDERFLYGNIYDQTFKQIWEGSRRQASLSWAQEEFDVSKCRVNCRMDEINRFLWGLKNQPQHINFI